MELRSPNGKFIAVVRDNRIALFAAGPGKVELMEDFFEVSGTDDVTLRGNVSLFSANGLFTARVWGDRIRLGGPSGFTALQVTGPTVQLGGTNCMNNARRLDFVKPTITGLKIDSGSTLVFSC